MHEITILLLPTYVQACTLNVHNHTGPQHLINKYKQKRKK